MGIVGSRKGFRCVDGTNARAREEMNGNVKRDFILITKKIRKALEHGGTKSDRKKRANFMLQIILEQKKKRILQVPWQRHVVEFREQLLGSFEPNDALSSSVAAGRLH